MLRRPFHGGLAGALRCSGDVRGAAAGKEILVAAAPPWSRRSGVVQELQSIPAHLLALGGSEPRGLGGIVTTSGRANDVRAAGRTSRLAIRSARALRFPGPQLA